MQDIPMFTTAYGIVGLGLKEIPYKQTAYIHIQAIKDGCLNLVLEESTAFCRAAGAEKIFACGHKELEQYPFHCTIDRMSLSGYRTEMPAANAFPVTDQTVGRWREIYNKKMKNVDHSATLSFFDEKRILSSGCAYFIHQSGVLFGIGWIREGKILAIASCVYGKGAVVLDTLMSTAPSEQYTLEVASTNLKAIRLYQKMGFIKTGEENRWHQIL